MEEHKTFALAIFACGFWFNFSVTDLESPFIRDLRKICVDGTLIGGGMAVCYLMYVNRNK
ncbi:hypothetical protein Klosneuvirus_1_96 [Klosneuvirus KNV1]|uniref:Uncharacterized protein n=1 Tax=Klosneuvirus KNV1 TaxID=1977640 RepID=A0A1V0SHP1_9VIRU|nr:hypothetical protein Klosneuvirus_1_96 [Klosneuvirus KNV1]